MVVSANEFQTNFAKYIDMLSSEDIFITSNGTPIAKVVNPQQSAVESLSGMLEGKVPLDFDEKTLREERINRYLLYRSEVSSQHRFGLSGTR